MSKGYKTITKIDAPFVTVRGVEDIIYGELGEIELANKTRIRFEVIELSENEAVLQVFDNMTGVSKDTSTVYFSGKTTTFAVGEDMFSRVFDGMGRPIDGNPEILPEKRVEVNGSPTDPAKREYPKEILESGIAQIDEENPIRKGQNYAIFTENGAQYISLISKITNQLKIKGSDEKFAVVFASMGISSEDANSFIEDLRDSGAIDRSVMFVNLAGDSSIERFSVPRLAMTAAEYLAFEKDMQVLVVMTDFTAYAESLREIAAGRGRTTDELGYPSDMYMDFASILERSGLRKESPGSITTISVASLPLDDMSHPAIEALGNIAEGSMVLAREI